MPVVFRALRWPVTWVTEVPVLGSLREFVPLRMPKFTPLETLVPVNRVRQFTLASPPGGAVVNEDGGSSVIRNRAPGDAPDARLIEVTRI